MAIGGATALTGARGGPQARGLLVGRGMRRETASSLLLPHHRPTLGRSPPSLFWLRGFRRFLSEIFPGVANWEIIHSFLLSMRTRRGELAPLVYSSVDRKLCTEYRDGRLKQRMVCDGDLTSVIHCSGFRRVGACSCAPCVVCGRRVCPEGPGSAPAFVGGNGVWIGLHCFVCFQGNRPEYRVWYAEQVAQRV